MWLPSAPTHSGPNLESFSLTQTHTYVAQRSHHPVQGDSLYDACLRDEASRCVYLSAGLSGSIKRMTGGADRVSVAKTPPCSWIPKPVSGSPLRMTSLVSTWKTCPPGPTELDARDTGGTRGVGRGGGGEGAAHQRGISAEKWWQEKKRRRMWGQSMEVGREKGQCGLGDVTGAQNESCTPPPAPQPHTHTLYPLLRHWRVTSVTTHKSVRTVRGRNAREKWLKAEKIWKVTSPVTKPSAASEMCLGGGGAEFCSCGSLCFVFKGSSL